MMQSLKTGKRWCSFFLSLCLLCNLFVAVPVEAAEILTNGNWEYAILADGTVEIIGYKGEATEVVIPGTIEGKSVTKIGERAFFSCRSLTNIELPSGVTEIGGFAFYGCRSLTSIELPSSVTKIGAAAFNSCISLTSIEIPSGVTEIGGSVFSDCSSLTDINVASDSQAYASKDGVLYNKEFTTLIYCPARKQGEFSISEEVTKIGNSAFYKCSSLTSIEIPSGVTEIGDNAFYGCSSLTSIEIPSRVEKIGEFVFRVCSSLTNINVASDSQTYASKDGCLYDKEFTTFICCPGGKQGEICVSERVTEIRSYAFEGCRSLTNIEIPSGVTEVKTRTFSGCSSLMSIEIPSGVTEIGNNAFYGCRSLTSIEIPSGVTEIGWSAFDSCSSLTSIEIPSGVTEIGTQAFYGCISLTSIEIPSGVTKINKFAFNSCRSLTGIVIPSGVTSIGERAFEGCRNLIIYGEAGSYAEEYAKKEGIKFICLHHTPVTDPAIAATCTEDGKTEGSHCTVCGEVIQEQEVVPASHTIEVDSAIAPTCTEDGKTEGSHCTVCGEVIQEQEVVPASHTIEVDPAIAPTCTEDGKTEGSHCAACGEIIEAQKVIPATGHTYQQTTQKATAKKNGAIVNKCSACGSIKSITTIHAASGIKLSKTSFTYNGKNKKPTVTIRDSKGNKLPAGSYKITRPKTSKKVGKYTVTVTLQGNYSGTVKLTYQITPKGTSISKLTAKKKGFTAKWKKQTGQTTGYQLQYSTSKKFKGAKTVTVKKNKTISKSIKKLKAGKKYYVRIRTYKTVKIKGKSVKICSGWSKVKSVKTKK